MKNDVSQTEREKQTGRNRERRRGRSEKHVYLLWIDVCCRKASLLEIFPKSRETRGEEARQRQTEVLVKQTSFGDRPFVEAPLAR